MIECLGMSVRKEGRTICKVDELSVERGSRHAIVGANGSGKTTLLRVLAGLESQFVGQVKVGVQRKDRVYVQQSPLLFRGTVLSNVEYGLRARKVASAARQNIASEWMQRLGLSDLRDQIVTNLSGGEIRRVALARAMAIRPALLLLDEPLSDMDAAGAQAVVSCLAELTDTTIVVASPSANACIFASQTYTL